MITSIILAAGKSSRMKSDKSKVLHEIGHRPLICHVLALTQKAVVVVPPDSKEIQERVRKDFPDVLFATQDQPLGTGHAVKAGFEKALDADKILVLYGDTPLLTKKTIDQLLECAGDCALLTMEPKNPAGYGRIVQNEQGNALKIVECQDATPQEKKISLCFGGCLVVKADLLKTFLPQIQNNNPKQEYYLVTLIELLSGAGYTVKHIVAHEEELLGVNDRSQLAAAEGVFQNRMRTKALDAGVTLQDPASVYFAHDTVLSPDVVVEPHVYFGPKVCSQKGSWIRAFSYIEGADIGENCIVGPFARIRPQTTLESKARAGNFVEIKNATLKKGAKVNHLSYIGDASVGEGTNVGAGTVTCNYDGFSKHQTVIGQNVLVGSNTSLIAPVNIEDGAVIGAGSVITQNVSQNSIALGRSEQKEIKEGALRYRNKRKH
jgi:bifunctional UDP-N-acetylglucosamine pyrophosphorylase/glucosamine-1-phosphate N-acetyltransferase